MTTIQVRQHNGKCEHGPWYPIGADIFNMKGHEDVPQWVTDAVADEIAESSEDTGSVERGGSKWIYCRS